MRSGWIDRSLPEGHGHMIQALEAFNRRFVDVTESREVFDLLTGDRMTYADFKAIFRHQRHQFKEEGGLKKATEYWLDWPDHAKVFRYTYIPGQEEFVQDCVNLWKDITPKPIPGDITPWLTLLDHVFRDLKPEERHWVNCWMAYPFQHPGTKLHTALMIYSAVQGVGKGLITETLKALYGIHSNDSFSNAATIGNHQLASTFNAWIARRQLIVCDEISVVSAEREVVAERVKSFITEHSITVNQKYAREITLPNYANFIITSNSPAALKIEDADRRYFVIGSTAPAIDPKFARSYVNWRDSEPDPGDENAPTPGLNALMHYFLTYDTRGFDPAAASPVTMGKTEVVVNSSAIYEVWLRDVKNNLDKFPDLVTAQELMATFLKEYPDYQCSIQAFSMAMTRQGFTQASAQAIPVDGRLLRLRVLKNHDVYKNLSDPEKGKAYRIQHMPEKPQSYTETDLSTVTG